MPKISELLISNPAGPLTGGEGFHGEQGSAGSVGVTVEQVGDYIFAYRLGVIRTISGTSDTPTLADTYGYMRATNGSAVAITVPPNSAQAFAIGTVMSWEQGGAGTVTLGPGSGVTLQSRGGLLATAGQFGVIQAKKVGTDTWTVLGDLA